MFLLRGISRKEIIILLGGFSNAGKSSLVESVATAFGLKRWKDHPNKKVWISNETGQEKKLQKAVVALYE